MRRGIRNTDIRILYTHERQLRSAYLRIQSKILSYTENQLRVSRFRCWILARGNRLVACHLLTSSLTLGAWITLKALDVLHTLVADPSLC